MLREPYKGDWIRIRNMPAPEEDIVQSIADKQLAGRLLHRLSTRQLIIVTAYFYDDRNLSEIGARLGISTERTRQILLRALRAMKARAYRMKIKEYEDGSYDRKYHVDTERQREHAERRRKERDEIVKQKIEVGNSLDQFLRIARISWPRKGFVVDVSSLDPNLWCYRWTLLP